MEAVAARSIPASPGPSAFLGRSVDDARATPRALRSSARRPRVRTTAVVDTGRVSRVLDPEASKSVLGIVLGGGAGLDLYPLTKRRATPAVPLGANYRLIDIPLSNCINSNVRRIYVLTQFNSYSLHRHLTSAYANNMGDGFVEILAAQQSPESPDWFQGTADAVRQYLWMMEDDNPEIHEYLILAGDHLYRMDYQEMIEAHRNSGADVTVAALPVCERRATHFGLMKIDGSGRITEFAEKPQGEHLQRMQVDTTALGLDAGRAAELPYIASMGIYVVNRSAMRALLEGEFAGANDFGSEIIPAACQSGVNVRAFLYDGYWEDIGDIESFYHANLSLADENAPFRLYDRSAPLYTASRFLPPSKLNNVDVASSMIGEGCIIQDCRISHSVVGLRSVLARGAVVEDSLLMGADYYETDAQLESLLASGGTPLGIGANSVIRKAIVDKNARIGESVHIINADGVNESARESEGFCIRSGIVTVLRDAIIPAGTVI